MNHTVHMCTRSVVNSLACSRPRPKQIQILPAASIGRGFRTRPSFLPSFLASHELLGLRFCVCGGVLFQGTVETCSPGRLKVYKGEWFVCSWKISNTGGMAFVKGTKLSRVRAQNCSHVLPEYV